MPSEKAPNPCLEKIELTKRVEALRKIYFAAMPEICIERARLVTKFSAERGLFEKGRISILDKARLYRSVLENKKAVVDHTKGHWIKLKGSEPLELDFKTLADPVPLQLFAGSTTQKFKGVPIYPEFQGLMIWPELETISSRAKNPYYISAEDAEALNKDIFPFWINDTILELARNRRHLKGVRNLKSGRLWGESEEIKLFERLVFFLASKAECISHTIPDFTKAIRRGLKGIIEDAENEKKERSHDPFQRDFYTSISEVLAGIIAYSHSLAKEACQLAAGETGDRAKELCEIADIYRHVPEKPARNFREALTTIWVCWTALHLENVNIGISLGRLDQILYEYYQKEFEDRGLDQLQRAAELLCCFWLKIGDHVPMVPQAAEQLFGGGGSNQAITIGGVNENGEDAVNELTYLILKTIVLMKLRDPNLNARYYPGINDKNDKDKRYLRAICEANIRTGATPAIHNDIAVIEALQEKGDSLEHARDYGIVGCVEPVSCGRAYGACSSILLNLASVLELTLFNGRHRHTHKHTGMDGKPISIETGSPDIFQTFDDFKKAFEAQTRWMVNQATMLNNLLGRIHQDFYPTPILSAFFEGPMEKGKDLSQGGALINSSGVAIIGFADVVDSLSAIQKVVFGCDPIPFAELRGALEKDFEGYEYESLYRRLLDPKKTPKYGTDDPGAIENAAWLVRVLDEAFGSTKNGSDRINYRGGKYRVGYWTLTMHTGFARLTGALPSGRKKGESFASGITPVSGLTPWVVESCNAVAKLPSKLISNGMAFNVKLSPEGEPMLPRLMALVDGFFGKPGTAKPVSIRHSFRHGDDEQEDRHAEVQGEDENGTGGMEIQFNIISQHDLERAMNHPEEYPELLVRVSGYTAYFKDLGPEMQKEIISRTEFLLLHVTKQDFAKAFPLPKIP